MIDQDRDAAGHFTRSQFLIVPSSHASELMSAPGSVLVPGHPRPNPHPEMVSSRFLLGQGTFRADYNEHLRRGLSISAAFRRAIAVLAYSSVHIYIC